ncbi:MAG: nicotinate-nucleotide--dimethylbenzimidazole phosphoribosyltransferase [Actinocatenispora sp.]
MADTVRSIRPPDDGIRRQARDLQDRLTKPAGSLGVLEDVSVRLAGLTGQCPPKPPVPAVVAVFAADHGVHAQKVTPWPQEVTGQMVASMRAGRAVVNAFARQVGAAVRTVDVGVAGQLPPGDDLVDAKVRAGTADMTEGPAMTRDEAVTAVEVGIRLATELVDAGHGLLVTGDMGIANTTASAALIAVLTGADPAEVTGRGTGIDDAMHDHKIEVVRRALRRHRPDRADPVEVLACVGGLEHAALAGFVLGAAAARTPVVLDGVIAGAAALVAAALAPDSTAAMIAGHRSVEPGHRIALRELGLRPLLDLDLRLGEGTGALLAVPLVQAAARTLTEVATFDSAQVSERND